MMADTNRLVEMLEQAGSREVDPGCGCCADVDRCRWCGQAFEHQELDDGNWGYRIIHDKRCPWVLEGFSGRVEETRW